MTTENPKFVLHGAEIDEQAESFSHPWNPNSLMTGTRMSRLTGPAKNRCEQSRSARR